jgi:periplasmic divalent cation tolerance protein
MTSAIQVVTTLTSKADAEKLAQALVERRLAACVQVSGPVASCYRWQGAVESAEEWVCTIKTRQDLYPQLEAALRELHPYQTPEILALPVVAGLEDYLHWLEQETKQP